MLTTNIAIRKNKKFTTAAIGCFLRLPLTKHNLAYASLLARIQMNSSLSYPSLALQQKRLAELYDLQLEIMPQVFGKEILLTYYANFVEPIEILDPPLIMRWSSFLNCGIRINLIMRRHLLAH